MTTRLSVTAIRVLDQDEALDFYVNKLGLEKGPRHPTGPIPLADCPVPG
jgi:catechol 2,3-dioxygenase-like lactoylglutathione lyase family enzyme